MQDYNKRSIALAVALSLLAGYVDANGFLATQGLFVSFMSGNSTRLGISLGTNHTQVALASFGIILTFIVGVVLGSLVASFAGERRKKAVLLLVGAFLLAATGFTTLNLSSFGIGALVLAMGAENAVFQKDGEVSIGVTYMTGSLVKLGQRIASALRGQPATGILPYFLLWAGLVLGAVFGVIAHDHFANGALILSAAYALVLAWFAPIVAE